VDLGWTTNRAGAEESGVLEGSGGEESKSSRERLAILNELLIAG
jgi:hypothetical protein